MWKQPQTTHNIFMNGCGCVSLKFHYGSKFGFLDVIFICHEALFWFFFPFKNVKISLSSLGLVITENRLDLVGGLLFAKPCSGVQKSLCEAAFWNLLSGFLGVNAASRTPAPVCPAGSWPEPIPSVARPSLYLLTSISPSVQGGWQPSPRAPQNSFSLLFGRKRSIQVQKLIMARVMCLACLSHQGERFDFSGCHSWNCLSFRVMFLFLNVVWPS